MTWLAPHKGLARVSKPSRSLMTIHRGVRGHDSSSLGSESSSHRVGSLNYGVFSASLTGGRE